MKYLFIIVAYMLLSCKNDGNLKQDLIRLQSSSVNIPKNIAITYNGLDTVIANFYKSIMKFIIYTDSIGCTSCSINKMNLWEPFLNYAKVYNGELGFFFIFHPTNKGISNLRNAMMLNPIDYPMLIDLNGDFEKMNPHLPKNKAMHTFLLDENNKVILVGNPLYNKEIEKLFYKKTQELLAK